MNGGDLAMPNAEQLMDHFDHGSQAVGGAGGCRHDAMGSWQILVVVHTHHHIEHARVLHGCGHHHPLGPAVEVTLQGLWREEFSRALQHHVHALGSPVDVAWGGVAGECHAMACGIDAVPIGLGRDGHAPAALYGVKGQ